MNFRTRLSLLFGGLLIVALAIALLSIDQIAKSSALQRIQESLSTTVKTVDKLHRQRVRNLQQNLRLLAGDYGFKSAYATEDEPTIRSALRNHQNRLVDANLMILSDLDGLVVSNTYHSSLNGTDFPWSDLLDQADDSQTGEITAFGLFDEQVYQLIVTPLLAPDPEAWVISGFQLDKATATQFSDVTGSQISFLIGEGGNSKLIASTLSENDQQLLLKQLSAGSITVELQENTLSDETFIGHFLSLNEDASTPIIAFVQQSLDQALAPYEKLSDYVMWIFIGSILGALTLVIVLSKTVTRSLTALSRAAHAVTQGELGTRVAITGKDEFSLLGTTFNEMTIGLEEKERVRNLLGKVVSPEIASKLLKDGIELGGEEREVTILFSDIQGFTRLSEAQAPTQTLNALNAFFSGMSHLIESHGGVVDKYIGDAVMALFGAPVDDKNHAENAVSCALEMCRQSEQLLAKLETHDGLRCSFGIGIHTGTVVAGNIGSASRLNYTVIGDAVNVASRVEGQTRMFQTPLIVTEATANYCSHITFQKLEKVKLKGRREKIGLLTLPELIDRNNQTYN